MVFETNKYAFRFHQFETIRSCVDIILMVKKESNLLNNIIELNSTARLKSKGNKKERDTYEIINSLNSFSCFKSGIFPLKKPTQRKGIKILTPEQTF